MGLFPSHFSNLCNHISICKETQDYWKFHFQLTLYWKFDCKWHVCTQSSEPFEQFGSYTFKFLIALAAFSIAILIIIWNSQHHVSTHNLQSRDEGFVFPLYHYYDQFPNASEGEMWHKSSTTNGRGLQSVRLPFFKLRFVDIDLTTSVYMYHNE